MLTLLAIVVIFGVHSLVDWTWFVPGDAIPALLCAGWLAGRGPVVETFGPRGRPGAVPVVAAAVAGRRLALLAAWQTWQPAAFGATRARRRSAPPRPSACPRPASGSSRALELNPLSVEPLNERAAVESAAGNLPARAARAGAGGPPPARRPGDVAAPGRLRADDRRPARRPRGAPSARRCTSTRARPPARRCSWRRCAAPAPRRRPARWRPSRPCRPPPPAATPARAPAPRSRRSPRPDARPRARRAGRRGAGRRAPALRHARRPELLARRGLHGAPPRPAAGRHAARAARPGVGPARLLPAGLGLGPRPGLRRGRVAVALGAGRARSPSPSPTRPARGWPGARAGVLAAALVAVHPLLVWFSQEARAYALVGLFAALSLVGFLRVLERPDGRAWAAWAVPAALALATHYYAGFLVLAEAAWLVWRCPRDGRMALAAGGVAATALALAPLALAQRSTGNTAYIGEGSVSTRLVQVPKQLLTGYASPGQALTTALLALLVVVAAARLATVPDRARSRPGAARRGARRRRPSWCPSCSSCRAWTTSTPATCSRRCRSCSSRWPAASRSRARACPGGRSPRPPAACCSP